MSGRLKVDNESCEYLQYTEYSSKKNQCGLKERSLMRKIVNLHIVCDSDRCTVFLPKEYLPICPLAGVMHDAFHLHFLSKVPVILIGIADYL